MLEGKNVVLRQLKISDWEKSLQWRNNLAIKQMAMMHSFPVTEFVEREWYESVMKSKSDRTIYFTVTTEDDNPIGFVSLTNINYQNRNCYLGIVIGETKNQGKGFGRESIELLIQYAFNTLNLIKISLEVVEKNFAAIKLYKSLGFVEEGKLKKHHYCNGDFLDVIVFSLFKETEEP